MVFNALQRRDQRRSILRQPCKDAPVKLELASVKLELASVKMEIASVKMELASVKIGGIVFLIY